MNLVNSPASGTLAFEAGITQNGNGSVIVTKDHTGRVLCNFAAGGTLAGSSLIKLATLPAGFRPSSTRTAVGIDEYYTMFRLRIDSDGSIMYYNTNGPRSIAMAVIIFTNNA